MNAILYPFYLLGKAYCSIFGEVELLTLGGATVTICVACGKRIYSGDNHWCFKADMTRSTISTNITNPISERSE